MTSDISHEDFTGLTHQLDYAAAHYDDLTPATARALLRRAAQALVLICEEYDEAHRYSWYFDLGALLEKISQSPEAE